MSISEKIEMAEVFLEWKHFLTFLARMRTKDSFAAVVVAFLWSVKNALCRQIYSQMQHTVYYLIKVTLKSEQGEPAPQAAHRPQQAKWAG